MIDEHKLDLDYLAYLQRKYHEDKYSQLIMNLNDILVSYEYNELLINYKEYVTYICKLFEELNVTSPLDIVLLYNRLLNDGIFSKNKKFTGINTSKQDLLVQTWGSGVATGNAVCRHCTLLLMDIERYFGNKVEAVDIYILNKFRALSRKLLETNNLYSINHVVMGFEDNGETLIYDPLNCSFLFKKDNIERKHPLLISIDNNFYYYDFNLCFLINGINNYELDYSKLPTYFKMNKDYIESRINYINNLVDNNQQLINDFHMDNSKKIKILAYLNQYIINSQRDY